VPAPILPSIATPQSRTLFWAAGLVPAIHKCLQCNRLWVPSSLPSRHNKLAIVALTHGKAPASINLRKRVNEEVASNRRVPLYEQNLDKKLPDDTNPTVVPDAARFEITDMVRRSVPPIDIRQLVPASSYLATASPREANLNFAHRLQSAQGDSLSTPISCGYTRYTHHSHVPCVSSISGHVPLGCFQHLPYHFIYPWCRSSIFGTRSRQAPGAFYALLPDKTERNLIN
jgi:hypothetical protein